ncbi:MAG: hypothetical protein MPI93_04065 [Nitrosopumilus sp.]|nr:hypothetical protein [Nitrosopumilus sp.]
MLEDGFEAKVTRVVNSKVDDCIYAVLSNRNNLWLDEGTHVSPGDTVIVSNARWKRGKRNKYVIGNVRVIRKPNFGF